MYNAIYELVEWRGMAWDGTSSCHTEVVAPGKNVCTYIGSFKQELTHETP